MIDTLTIAHATGYEHGIVVGTIVGGILGCTIAVFVLGLMVAAKDGDRAIGDAPAHEQLGRHLTLEP